MAELEWPTVLVVGLTGVGKTSLLQAIFGPSLVSEDMIGHGKPHTSGFDLYESDGLRIYDSKGMEPGDQHADDRYQEYLYEFVKVLRSLTNPRDHIHVIWYCIQGCGGRITPKDIEIIKDLSSYFYILVIITKSDITRVDQLESLMNVMTCNGILKEIIVPVSTMNTFQLDDLLKKTEALYESSHAKVVEHAARWRSDARKKAEEAIEQTIQTTRIRLGYGTEDLTKKLVADIADIYCRTDILYVFMHNYYTPWSIHWSNILFPVFICFSALRHVREYGYSALRFFSTVGDLSKVKYSPKGYADDELDWPA